MKPRSLFYIYMKNITNASIINASSVILKIYLTNDELDIIFQAIDSSYDRTWICIQGRAILKTDEIKRVVRVDKDGR